MMIYFFRPGVFRRLTLQCAAFFIVAYAAAPPLQAQDRRSHPLWEANEELLAEGIDVEVYSSERLYLLSPDGQSIAAYVEPETGEPGILQVNGQQVGEPYTPDGKPGFMSFSPDGKRIAVHEKVNPATERLVVDGKPDPEFREVQLYHGEYINIFSDDSKHMAYVGIARDYSRRLMVNGKSLYGDEELPRIKHFEIGPDGSLFYMQIDGGDDRSFTTKFGGKVLVKHPFAHFVDKSTVFSPDGKRIAYAVEIRTIGDANAREFAYVVDGKVEAERFDQVAGFKFNQDGSSYAYLGLRGWEMRAVRDGKPGKPFTRISDHARWHHLEFCPNGKRTVFYAATEDSRDKHPVVDDVLCPPITKSIGDHRFCFSGDSKDFAYIGQAEKRLNQMILNGKPVGQASRRLIFPGSFTGSKQDQLLFAVQDGPWHLIQNDKTVVKYPGIHNIVVSPDAKRTAVAVVVDRDEHYVILDGVKGKAYTRIDPGSLTFSADSSTLAYTASRMQLDRPVTVRVIGDQEHGTTQPSLPFTLSEDGAHFYYKGHRGNEGYWIDGLRIRKGLEPYAWPPKSIDRKTVTYLARDGDKLYRVTHKFK
ncbi:MAG: hypothetical protein AAGB26_06495 [Planctomycetota bacterium]